MREIRFRAWNNKLKLWETFTNVKIEMDGGVIHSHYASGKSTVEYFRNCPDVVVMQYTGLKDKNGKEIYEGDIVKFSEHYSGDHFCKESTEVIEWDKVGYTDSLWIGYADQPDWCEVIGNIYENPELLENK